MSKHKLSPPVRCSQCKNFLVDITVPNPPKHAPRLEQGCKACERLELVDVVCSLYERVGAGGRGLGRAETGDTSEKTKGGCHGRTQGES